MPSPGDKQKGFWENLKDYIAILIVIFTFVVLVILIFFAFRGNTDFSNAKDIMGLLLPVIGTWMGTVLAFYFSRENFEAASKSMQQTIKNLSSEDKLKSTKATDVMIGASKIVHPFVDKKIEDVKLHEILQFLKEKKINRLVVMEDKKVKYVLHKSLIDSFISEQVLMNQASAEEIGNYTIEQMKEFGSQELKDKMDKGVEFFKDDVSLFEVQVRMNANANCQDIFITSGGKKDDEIIGWITNGIISDNIKV